MGSARFALGSLPDFQVAEPTLSHNQAVIGGMTSLVRALAISLIVLTAVSGCGDDSTPDADIPEGFDIPKGVTITPRGAEREVGESATVVYHVEQQAASAVTVRVTAIVLGSLHDFEFFNLPPSVQTSTPYYVHIKVRNRGPSGLGGVALPIFARTTKRLLPPNELVGNFRPCPAAALPESFLPGSTTRICLVFLIPEGENLQSIDLQTAAERDAIHFLPKSA